MTGFEEGFDFFRKNAVAFVGADVGNEYITTINKEIEEMVNNLNSFEGFNTSSPWLKGDVAEYWHAGTFNINAALEGSTNRAFVDRSHEFASTDVSTNFGADFGLKYYSNGPASARAQSTSVFQRFIEYRSAGGKDEFVNFMASRGIILSLDDPIYAGQVRVIPRDQLEEATKWLKRMINTESARRPEQVPRYKETLDLLTDRLSDNEGVESIPLSKDDAQTLAELAKQGKVNAEEMGYTTEALLKFDNIMQQAFKAGLSAATISVVLKVAPEIYKSINYLIQNGEIDREIFKNIGFAAISGGAEGFIRGSVSAALTTCCKAGLLGQALKSVDPSIIASTTVVTINVIKNAYYVAIGQKLRSELTCELIRDMYVSTCALVGGGVGQAFIEIPILGYLIGSFVGSVVGSFTYNIGYKTALSFCVETGFTMFGLVRQDYVLPEEVIKEIGISTFEYDTFYAKGFEPESFEFDTFKPKSFEPDSLDITFLRRGVIGISKVGYLSYY